MSTAHLSRTDTLTTFSPGKIERRSGPQHQPSKLKMLGKAALFALPKEIISAGRSYKQAKSDMENVKKLSLEGSFVNGEVVSGKEVKVSRRDVGRYMAFRRFMTGYELGDDVIGFPGFVAASNSFGTLAAYLGVAVASTALAYGIGEGERRAQQNKAKWLGLDTTKYEGPVAPDIGEAAMWSSPLVVYRHAGERPGVDDPVQIVSRQRVAAMSGTYGAANTGLYVAANSFPWVNGMKGFFLGLGLVSQFRGTVEGYKEQVEENMHNQTEWEKRLNAVGTHEEQRSLEVEANE